MIGTFIVKLILINPEFADNILIGFFLVAKLS